MSNQPSIMSDDLLSLFESKLQDIGLSEHISTEAVEHYTENQILNIEKNGMQLSFTEERAWMLHQQDPLASSGPFILAFRLSGKIEISRLSKAIQKLYEGDSNLNLRYDLDDEGILNKYHVEHTPVEVNIHMVKSEQEAIQYLLSWIQKPINLAKAPAIQFTLFPQNHHEVILGILGHHILLDDSAWQPIFTQLSQNYVQSGGVLTASSNSNIELSSKTPAKVLVNSPNALQYWKTIFPTGLNQLDWPKFCRAPNVQASIIQYGQNTIFDYEQKAVRCSSSIPFKGLKQLSEQAQASIFHTVVAQFGGYLNHLFGTQSIDLFVPIVEQYEASSLSQIRSSSNILPIRILRPEYSEQESNIENREKESIVNVRNQILQGMVHNISIEQILSATKTKRKTIPNVLVTQFIDGSQFLKLEQVETSTLIIPPIHSDYDLTLAFQIKADEIHFELTTGEKLSKKIGLLLLEQWIEFLHLDAQQRLEEAAIFAFGHQASPYGSDQEHWAQPTLLVQPQVDASITQLILDEFKQVLMNPNLQADDNFFDFGGHSILATRVIGKLQTQHGLLIKIADFFNAPTALELSQCVEYLSDRVKDSSVADDDREIVAPLTLLQKAFMGFSNQGRDAMYNIPFAFRFSETVNEQAFYDAFLDILKRHHVMRSIFVQADQGEIFQTVIPMDRLNQHPWFWGLETQGNQSAQQILRAEANHSFDLMHEFPIRVRFLKDENGKHILSMLLYHIAMDEWSSGILMRELIQAYTSRVDGKAPIWEKTPRQFHEYAMAQDDSALQAHIQYWMNTIGKIKKQQPLLPAYRNNVDVPPPENNLDDVSGAAVEFNFTAIQVEQLYALARQYRSSLFYVVYAALLLTTYYLGAGKKVLSGTSVACRQDPNYQDTLGYFTNVVMHYIQFNESLSIKDLVNQVQNNIFKAQEYADIPFAIVEDNIRAEGEEWTESPYEVYVQLHAQNALTGVFQLNSGDEIGFELIEPERDTAKFGLHFEVYEEPSSEKERLRVVINYRVNRYNEIQIQLIRQVAQQVLESFIHIDTQSEECTQIDVMEIRHQLSTIQLPELAI